MNRAPGEMETIDDNGEGLAWRGRYSCGEMEIIGMVWRDRPPGQCKGKCELKDVHNMTICEGCGWDDAGLDN